MRKRIALLFKRLPMKWKMMLWSFALLFVLFFVYNVMQIIVINQWHINQEKEMMRNTIYEIQKYFVDKQSMARDIAGEFELVQKMVKTNQAIRIVDHYGNLVLAINDDLTEQWADTQDEIEQRFLRGWHVKNRLLVMERPLWTDNFNGSIQLINHLESLDVLVGHIVILMFTGGILTIILSGLGGLLLSRQLIKPIQSITDTIRKIKKEGLHERVELPDNKDELSYLATVFNELMGQLETSFRRQKRFVEDASHELRTPISIIEGHLSLLNRWGKNDADILNESLHASLQELGRLKRLVQELLVLSSVEALDVQEQFEPVVPEPIIAQIVNDLMVIYPHFKFQVNMEQLPHGKLNIDSHHLKQLILIFLDNAIHYSLNEKTIQIKANTLSHHKAEIHIIDYGIGISEAELPLIFDRFYRVDKARSRKQGGSGLGLAIAKRIVEKYKGKIVIKSDLNKGTTVTIILPFTSFIVFIHCLIMST